jgi:nucleoside-triphosphatase THEP1
MGFPLICPVFDFSPFLFYLWLMIFVLTGPVHSGKTSLLRKLIREWSGRKLGLDGFLSLAVHKDGELIGYDLFDLKRKKTLPYLRKEGAADREKVGLFFFIPEALEAAKRMLLRRRQKDFLIIDEAGPLEIQGGGIWPALQTVLSNPALRCLLVVRRSALAEFRDRLKAVPFQVFDIEDRDTPALLREKIQKSLSVE